MSKSFLLLNGCIFIGVLGVAVRVLQLTCTTKEGKSLQGKKRIG